MAPRLRGKEKSTKSERFAERLVERLPTLLRRSKRSHAAGFTLRYPLAQPLVEKASEFCKRRERLKLTPYPLPFNPLRVTLRTVLRLLPITYQFKSQLQLVQSSDVLKFAYLCVHSNLLTYPKTLPSSLVCHQQFLQNLVSCEQPFVALNYWH